MECVHSEDKLSKATKGSGRGLAGLGWAALKEDRQGPESISTRERGVQWYDSNGEKKLWLEVFCCVYVPTSLPTSCFMLDESVVSSAQTGALRISTNQTAVCFLAVFWWFNSLCHMKGNSRCQATDAHQNRHEKLLKVAFFVRVATEWNLSKKQSTFFQLFYETAPSLLLLLYFWSWQISLPEIDCVLVMESEAYTAVVCEIDCSCSTNALVAFFQLLNPSWVNVVSPFVPDVVIQTEQYALGFEAQRWNHGHGCILSHATWNHLVFDCCPVPNVLSVLEMVATSTVWNGIGELENRATDLDKLYIKLKYREESFQLCTQQFVNVKHNVHNRYRKRS